MKTNITYEVCPFCGEEVELKAELMVQTCPHCGKRIVTCSMCRATECDEDYCTHCCLAYQAGKENEDDTREAEFRSKVLHEEAPADGISKFIKSGVSLYDVISHWTADRGGEEYFALFDLENENDFRLFYENHGFKTIEMMRQSRYWFDGIDFEKPKEASYAEMVRIINTQIPDRIREERDNGDDIDYLWKAVFDMDGVRSLLGMRGIMDASNGHNADLVDQINAKWDRFKECFRPILCALYERDAEEILYSEAFSWDPANDVETIKANMKARWDTEAENYLMHIADDQDLETILTFVRFDVCEGTGRDRISR